MFLIGCERFGLDLGSGLLLSGTTMRCLHVLNLSRKLDRIQAVDLYV